MFDIKPFEPIFDCLADHGYEGRIEQTHDGVNPGFVLTIYESPDIPRAQMPSSGDAVTAAQRLLKQVQVWVEGTPPWPDATDQEYSERVKVMISPEMPHVHLENGTLAPDTQFWLYTMGLSEFGLYELEMRRVPGLWISSALSSLNTWSMHALRTKPIRDGETLLHGTPPIYMLLQAQLSKDPMWKGANMKCLHLTPIQFVGPDQLPRLEPEPS